MARPTNKDKIKALFNEYTAFIDKGIAKQDRREYDFIKSKCDIVIELLNTKVSKQILADHETSGGTLLTSPQEIQKTDHISTLDRLEYTQNTTAQIFNPYHAGRTIYIIAEYARSFYPFFDENHRDNELIDFKYKWLETKCNKENLKFKTAIMYVLGEEYDKTYLKALEPFLTPQIQEEAKKHYEKIISTPTTFLTKKLLNSPKNLTSVRRGQITTFNDPLLNKTTITYKGKTDSLELTIANFNALFSKQVRNGAKVFTYLLKEQNKQHKEEVSYMLSDLVGEHAPYSSLDSAYKGLKNILSKLDKVYVTGTHRKGNKEIGFEAGHIVLYHKEFYNKPCVVSFLPEIRENADYFTLIPNWAFGLNDTAFMLLDYIYYMARQNTSKIKNNGYFDINLDAVRKHLGLPEPKETTHHTQLIINPIDQAIEDIENTQDKNKVSNVKISPIYNYDYKSTGEYLLGHLKIELDEEATAYMTERGTIKANKIKNTIAKKDKEKAKIMAKIEVQKEVQN